MMENNPTAVQEPLLHTRVVVCTSTCFNTEMCLSITGVFNLLSSRANLHLSYNLRAAVIADYKIVMDIRVFNIIVGGLPGDV